MEFIGRRWIPLKKTCEAELLCSLWSAYLINGCVRNREAGDLRRHRAHYDVIVMGHLLCLVLNDGTAIDPQEMTPFENAKSY